MYVRVRVYIPVLYNYILYIKRQSQKAELPCARRQCLWNVETGLCSFLTSPLLLFFIYWRAPQQMLRSHRSLEGLLCKPVMKVKYFSAFPFNGVLMEWNGQGKTEVFGEKPVPLQLCPPQIPHGLTRDRTWASAVRDRRLTAQSMARPTSALEVSGWLIAPADLAPGKGPRYPLNKRLMGSSSR
jgi:hypothetical protein